MSFLNLFSTIALIVALVLIGSSLFLVVKDKIQNKKDNSSIFHRRRTRILFAGIISGYVSAAFSNVSLFLNNDITSFTFWFELLFYALATVLISYFALRNPVRRTADGEQEYHGFHYVFVFAAGCLPFVLLL